MAMPSEEDFDNTRSFLQAVESFWFKRGYSFNNPEEEWQDLDDDDEDKVELLKIQKDLAKCEGCSTNEVDNRLVIYEFLKRKYKKADCSWGRALMAGQIAIESACDPTLTYLDYHPGIEFKHVAPEQ